MLKRMHTIAAAVLATLAPVSAALAQDTPAPCPRTYATFEYAVPHPDLATCPAALAGDERFCRASVAADAAHVFVFSSEGEQWLVASRNHSEDEITLVIP